MKTLIAYHNDLKLKEALLAEVAKHRAADMLVSGTYGERDQNYFKGCAVGCSLHSLNLIQGKSYETNNHFAYEDAVGVPVALAYLQDTLFEKLSSQDQQEWPERFWNAIHPGADLRFVQAKWFVWTLLDERIGFWKVWKSKKDQELFKSFGQFVADVVDGKPFKISDWDTVRKPVIDLIALIDRISRIYLIDRIARIARIAMIDRIARIDPIARIDLIARIARIDLTAPIDPIALIDPKLSSHDLYKIAADKLLELLQAA